MHAVDSDTHFFEPLSLWRDYIEPAFREGVPRLVEHRGRLLLNVDETCYPASPVHAGLASLYLPDGGPTDAIREIQRTSVDPSSRLARMDRVGTFAEVIYPTLAMMGASEIRDPALAQAHARAYNRFAATHSAANPQRLRCAMIAPLNHPKQAAAEIEFARTQLGLGVLMATFSAPGDFALSSSDLDVVWATAQDFDVTVTFQDSSLAAGPTTSGLQRAHTWRILYLAAHVVEAQLGLADLILGGVLERFPRLRVGMHETHLTWIPSWLQLLDERFAAKRPGSVTPSESYRRQCFASAFPDEPGVRGFIESLGTANLVFSSDWPHRDLVPGTDPDWVGTVLRRDDLSPDEAIAALETNANQWFCI
jgi:uncharacterized protein